MIKEIKNISFKNGLVENFKQDNFTQADWMPGYQLTSALFLNNYNPNIEYNSLVLRYGLDILENYAKDAVLFTEVPYHLKSFVYADLFKFNALKAFALQHYTRVDYVDSEKPYNYLDLLFYSYPLHNTLLPIDQADPEHLWITSPIFHGVDPISNNESWQSLFTKSRPNNTTPTVSVPTFVPLGKYKNSYSVNSKVFFVTEPTNNLFKPSGYTPPAVKRKYYPVYTFAQVKDLRKTYEESKITKSYDFMNGLGDNILDDAFWEEVQLRRFIVKTPTPLFKDMKIATLRSLRTRNGNFAKAIDKAQVGEPSPNIDKTTSVSNINALYPLSNTFATDDDFISLSNFDVSTDTDTVPLVNLLVWEQPLLSPAINIKALDEQRPNQEKKSKYWTFQKLMIYQYLKETRGTWCSLPMMDFQCDNDKSAISNSLYKYPYIDTILQPEHIVINEAIGKCTDWKTNHYVLNNIPVKIWEHAHSNRRDNSSQRKIEEIKHPARFVVHDYIKVELPRAWFSGDKIPFILTAVLEGKETILLKQTYKVSDMSEESVCLSRGIIEQNAFGSSWSPLRPSHNRNDYMVTQLNDKDHAGYYLGYHKINRDYISNSSMLAFVNGLKEGSTAISPIDSMLLYDGYGNIDDGEYESLDVINLTSPPGKFTTDLCGTHNVIQFTIRLNKKALALLLAHNCSEIKVYASRPNNSDILFDRIGTGGLTDCPPIYAKPMINDLSDQTIIEGAKYALCKSFVLQGSSVPIEKYLEVNDNGSRTNAWKTSGDWIYAVPLKENSKEASSLPECQFDIPSDPPDPDDPPLNFTPDFFLWDYPIGDGLLIGDSGKVWRGTGNRCITVAKNRTFIAGCYDKDYVEEKSRVRWSSMNAGVHINDLFVEEAFMDVGALPITALQNYREQLWIFNKSNYYRVMLNEIHNPASWEFVDAKFGQGTYSPKTLISTPYGVAFCGEAGIFLTDGTNPANLVDNQEQVLAVRSLYQYIMLGKTNQYGKYNDFGDIYLEEGKTHNIFAELFYDTIADELVLTSPIRKRLGVDFTFEPDPEDSEGKYANSEYTDAEKLAFQRYYNSDTHLRNSHWVKLIFSFSNKNWRVETGINYGGAGKPIPSIFPVTSHQTYAEEGRMWENDRVCRKTIRLETNQPGNIDYNSSITSIEVGAGIYHTDIEAEVDKVYTPNEVATISGMPLYIWGEVITHNIGNGEDDYILMKAKIECTPKEVDNDTALNWLYYNYLRQTDPYFGYELRARTFSAQSANFQEIDLVHLNMTAKGGLNPFHSAMSTPNDMTDGLYVIDPDDLMVGRETLNMIAPMRKFRRTRFHIVSKILAKIETITSEFKVFHRRNY